MPPRRRASSPSPARRRSVRSPHASKAMKSSPSLTSIGSSNRNKSLNQLYMTLCSHDCIPRDKDGLVVANEMQHLQKAFRPLQKTWLYATFSISSFTYSFIGLTMLLYFNRRLPEVFWRTSVLDVDLYAVILVAQGPLSYWADVWARTALCQPQHIAYLADRASAAPMTVLTLYLGIVCWHEPSSPVGRSLASMSAIGLVPFVGSQLALARKRYELFMQLHIAWHTSIPLVAFLWLGHTSCGWFA